MRLKTKLVVAITTLVMIISGVLSLIYMANMMRTSVEQSYNTNQMVADEIRLAVQRALETGLKDRKVDPNNPEELRQLAAAAVRDNVPLQDVVDSVNRYSLTVYDINIGDSKLRTLLSTNPESEDRPLPVRPNFEVLLHASALRMAETVFGPPKVFDVVVPLKRNGEPFVFVHVGVRTTLLRAQYADGISELLQLMVVILGTVLVGAVLLSNTALRPLVEISKQLDYWTSLSTDVAGDEENAARGDMAARVSTKIERIGQRMRNVEEVFSAFKENLDQVLGNLQDGILLFTGDGRAVLVSEAARRFLNMEGESLLGRHAKDIFDRGTALGRTLGEAFDGGLLLVKEEVLTETWRRVEVSMDFIHDDQTRQGLGALVTLHDLESAEQIESELELSRRMAAIGRLTSGVGHEVKNPINAIVVHLELLKNKLPDGGGPAKRHLDVIDAEIHRLDRVVQVLADFSRPVELQLTEQDLRGIVDDVLTLAADEFKTKNVIIESRLPSRPVMAKVDTDLIKQAALNVILNGAQAMPEGGTLVVVLEEDRKTAVLSVTDQGYGIPEDMQEKIFDLYFTTKTGGSGIGLTMTYRILQLHHGSIELQSEVGIGTQFRMKIPLAYSEWGRRTLQPALVENERGLAE